MIFGEPALVGVAGTEVGRASERDRIALVGHVYDRERVLVRIETDLLILVVGVRAVIIHALGIVGVSIRGVATRIDRELGKCDVDHVKSAEAGIASDHIGECRVFIDHNVVSVSERCVVAIAGERHRRGGGVYISQTVQVKNLHAVKRCLAHDEGVVQVDLDVPPGRVLCTRGEQTDEVGWRDCARAG